MWGTRRCLGAAVGSVAAAAGAPAAAAPLVPRRSGAARAPARPLASSRTCSGIRPSAHASAGEDAGPPAAAAPLASRRSSVARAPARSLPSSRTCSGIQPSAHASAGKDAGPWILGYVRDDSREREGGASSPRSCAEGHGAARVAAGPRAAPWIPEQVRDDGAEGGEGRASSPRPSGSTPRTPRSRWRDVGRTPSPPVRTGAIAALEPRACSCARRSPERRASSSRHGAPACAGARFGSDIRQDSPARSSSPLTSCVRRGTAGSGQPLDFPPSSPGSRLNGCSAASLRRPISRIGGRWCGAIAATRRATSARVSPAQHAPAPPVVSSTPRSGPGR
ncbi:hypothetical protein EV292_102531 [Sphingomonas sp. BK235]|nr:hypothetical protein EV292_102531 [Sphingomonas sp. BK235]